MDVNNIVHTTAPNWLYFIPMFNYMNAQRVGHLPCICETLGSQL